MCTAFREYEDIPETYDGTWVASNISGSSGDIEDEAVEMRNWIVHFRCTSKELRAVVANLAEWLANSPPLGRILCNHGIPPGVYV